MKFLQVAKRISLLVVVNILVMFTIGIIVSLHKIGVVRSQFTIGA